MRTEARNDRSLRLDEMSPREVIDLMNAEEHVVLDALEAAAPNTARAAEAVARVHASGGRVFLLGAGTSGRLAAGEVAELPATFGVEPGSFVAFIASGPSGGSAAVTRNEDDSEAAPAALARCGCGPQDAVIGVAASGATPFVVAGINHASDVGAWTCGIANNRGSALLGMVDVGILLDTGPEIVTGSTRLKAGTAQKLVLNRITTAALVSCGKVMSNLMVEISPTNEKLRRRCVHIVCELLGASEREAVDLLDAAAWDVRAAVQSRLEGR